jgi:general stress protein CsbA
MGLLAFALAIPLALDGESAGGNSTSIAIISVVSMVAGYLLLAGLWYFVFRKKARAKRGGGDPPD